MENLYSNLHSKYSLSKTLRFELIPIGKTKKFIEERGLLDKDEHRAENYKKVKRYCDEYHKIFINNCMKDFKLNSELLERYYTILKKEKRNEEDKKELKSLEDEFRRKISERFQKDGKYNGLFGKEIINDYLMNMYKDDKEKFDQISEFKRFTTYFTGFNTNRKNMYISDEKSTAIAYRLINENLPIFLNNIIIYNKIKEILNKEILDVERNLNEYLQVNSIEDIFQVEYFNEVLTQIGIDDYNIFISGKSKEDGTKIKGLNEIINEYNQKHDQKIPKLHLLYKQILSDRNETSFLIDSIDDDEELVSDIQEFHLTFNNIIKSELVNKIENIENYDLTKIYLKNNLNLSQISKDIYDDWSVINNKISEDYDKNYIGRNKIGSDKYEEEKKKYKKNTYEYSISYLNNLMGNNDIVNYIKRFIIDNNIIENIKTNFKNCDGILNKNYEKQSKELIKDEKSIEKIKKLLDSIKIFQEFINNLIPKEKNIEKDDLFYNYLDEQYSYLNEIIPLYNKARNYLTQKPYSTEKIKLNFENDTFLNGWDVNKVEDNFGVLMIKDNKYYLGIINPNSKKIFDGTESKGNDICYQKVEYKLLPGPNKMLPKVFFSKSRIDEFKPSEELLEKYKNGEHKKGENFDLDFCHELINYYKKSIEKHEDWKKFDFKFKDTRDYNDIGQFYKDVEQQGYKIKFTNYSEKYIDSLIEKGDLYLFEIYNKDFSKDSKGMPNMHTLYWKALFDENNFKERITYKLNGQAEVFYRKSSLKLEDTAIHLKNNPIKNKNPLNKNETSTFNYDIIKNRRYTVDKFQFHVPITLNFQNDGENILNNKVNEYLKNNEVNVIGIDRGERNLIYLSVVNSKGEILFQTSLNEIVNEYKHQKIITNYHSLLNDREKEREKARESWKTIENIKELKEGYLSQVIHKIVELMDKYKAIIVLEDLNNGFKNSRIKVEKQVYQKFEKMLIEKLNYLVFKNKDVNNEGGLFKAYQLTNTFESFNKLGKQTGVLFYIPAWCTSKIDPTTGFVNLINFKYGSIDKSKSLIERYTDIKFNEKEKYFEFYMDYSNFTNRSYGIRKNWIVCTYGDRIVTFRNPNKNNEFDYKKINLTEEFVKLFKKFDISYDNLKKSILENNEKEFWIEMMYLLRMTYQMRNSTSNSTSSKDDYIISPIKNNKGFFYDSRICDKTLPNDADANGAYNIARKGLMIINQIRESNEENLNKIKFNITNDAWLRYVQEQDI